VSDFDDAVLPGLPSALIRAAYDAAPGREIESGKFTNPESSAALVANAFGFFLERPNRLPALPGTEALGWPATSVALEAEIPFPWLGGRRPCLDVLIETDDAIIGIESKRYEPFRPRAPAHFAETYWRPVWGRAMNGFEGVRDALRLNPARYASLDGAQLVKHSLGMRTAVQNRREARKLAILYYLYAEPAGWPDGRTISPEAVQAHRLEVASFAASVSENEVRFISCSYRELLGNWSAGAPADVQDHVRALQTRFAV
jgi:hypothetical protein